MKKRKQGIWKRIVQVTFCMLLAVSCICSQRGVVSAAVEKTTGDYTGNGACAGVEVKTTTDKSSYRDGDTAEITVSVTNTNSYELTDVSAEFTVPKNFTLKDSKAVQKIERLAAGETKEYVIQAEVTKDSSAPEMSGADWQKTVFVLVLICIVWLILLFLVKRYRSGKKFPKAPVSMLLVVCMTSSFVLSPAVTADAWTEEGLVQDFDYYRTTVHDPSVVKDPKTGMYYIFGSHLAFSKSEDLVGWSSFQTNIHYEYEELFESPWKWAGDATKSEGSLSGRMWAPDVIWNETMQKWCMYMSIDGDNWCSVICLLTADDIEGPYEYQGNVVYSGVNNAKYAADPEQTDIYQVLDKDEDLSRYRSTSNACINAIDPCVKYDENGDLYMVYGSWSAGIYILKLDKATGLRDYTQTYETKIHESDAYYGIKVAGGYYNSGEGPYIIHSGDYYYLFISYGALEAAGGYQMRVYRSENITGPYYDQAGNSSICHKSVNMVKSDFGLKLFGSYDMEGISTVQVAQGHNSALVDDDGKILLVYHTRFQSETGTDEGHQVRVHQLFVTKDGWLAAAPYEYSGETLPEESYEASKVSGEYDFIYHNPQESYNVIQGNQYGIMGSEEQTVSECTVQKEMGVAGHQAVVKVKVSFAHEGSAKVVVQEDGTVTGDYAGTWEFTEGNYVEMTLNGTKYTGVFLEQQDETTDRAKRMTFTLVGDNKTAWGVSKEIH